MCDAKHPSHVIPWQAVNETLTLRPVNPLAGKLFGAPGAVTLPLPAALRTRSSWHCTYADGDARIARSDGRLYIFRRVLA